MSLKEYLKENITKIGYGAIAVGVGALFGMAVYTTGDHIVRKSEADKIIEYNDFYQETRDKYGDFNNDGIVTPSEEYKLDLEILANKDVIYKKGESVKYENGEDVSIDTLNDWLEDYVEGKK